MCVLMHDCIPEAGDVQKSHEFLANGEGSCHIFLRPFHSYINLKVDDWNALKMKPEASSILSCFASLGKKLNLSKSNWN